MNESPKAMKLRIIYDDSQKEVVRDIVAEYELTLEALHYQIVYAFGMHSGELASFIVCDEQWESLYLITTEEMKDTKDVETSNPKTFANTSLQDIFTSTESKVVYTYDFGLNLRFLIYPVSMDETIGEDAPDNAAIPIIANAEGDVSDEIIAKKIEQSVHDPDSLDTLFDEDEEDEFYGTSYDEYEEDEFL